jgi:hypothetical protein
MAQTRNLRAACDFYIRERAGTRVHGPDGRPAPEWGLLPAGHLEDNPEWRHWFSHGPITYQVQSGPMDVTARIELSDRRHCAS